LNRSPARTVPRNHNFGLGRNPSRQGKPHSALSHFRWPHLQGL